MSGQRRRTILFVCTGNSCRSQMAEGFARELFPEWAIHSAGASPAGMVHPMSVEVMREVGIDITDQRSKGFREVPIDEVDVVITLCGSARERCPTFPNAKQQEHWPIEDPFEAEGPEARGVAYRRVRDEIDRRVRDLAERLKG